MNEVARWITLQEPLFAVPLKGAVGRMVEDFGLSASEAGMLLEEGIRTGAISLQDADTGAVWLPSPRAMATQIDWASGWLVLGDQPVKMLVIHWPDVERVARTQHTGVTIDGQAVAATPILPSSEDGRCVTRAKYTEAALSAWFILREKTWPIDSPSPNEASDMDAARQYFDSIPPRDVFRRIRQEKTTKKWRTPGPRSRR